MEYLKQALEFLTIKNDRSESKMKSRITTYFSVLIVFLISILIISIAPNIIKAEYNEKEDTDFDITKYYKLVELEPTANRKYQYQLLNDAGAVIYEDTTFRLPPEFSIVEGSIVKVRTSAGTGVYFDMFYSFSDNKISEFFYTPYATFGEYVVSIQYIQEEDDTFIFVKDMFDSTRTYLSCRIDVSNQSFPNSSIHSIELRPNDVLYVSYEAQEDDILVEKLYVLKDEE